VGSFEHHLVKPVDPDQLFAILGRCARQAERGSEVPEA